MGLLDQIDLSKITPRSLKAEDMGGAILAAIFFVSWYSRNLGGSKLNVCPAVALLLGISI